MANFYSMEMESKTNSQRLVDQIKEIQSKFKVIGRDKELRLLLIAIRANKNIILEGLVGTGKTYLAKAVAEYTDKRFIRVDGSEDVYAHTLTGYFDPPAILKKGYGEDSFIKGPLTRAMEEGACLFVNELNRLPEQTQNVLLSALDERKLIIPKLKTIEAKDGFFLIATQNPEAHVGVSALGEALKDRFIWIKVDYQSEEEEIAIVKMNLLERNVSFKDNLDDLAKICVLITRKTRSHPDIRRGASVRGAIDLADIIQAFGKLPPRDLWYEAAVMALHTKLELMEGTEKNSYEIIKTIVDDVLDHF